MQYRKRTAQASFNRKTDARKWAQKTEVAIREDQYAINPMPRRKTLGELIEQAGQPASAVTRLIH